MRPQSPNRADYRHLTQLGTRWMDNDVYGHLNNAVHYSLFDTAVNVWLHDQGFARPDAPVIGLVVSNGCDYFAELRFPEPVVAGLRIGQIGRSSVRYELGLFGGNGERAAASGHLMHVYVDRQTRRPAELPAAMRQAMQGLLAAS